MGAWGFGKNRKRGASAIYRGAREARGWKDGEDPIGIGSAPATMERGGRKEGEGDGEIERTVGPAGQREERGGRVSGWPIRIESDL